MDQAHVVAGLEVHIGLLDEAVVDDHLHAIGPAHGWNGAKLAVAEQLPDLALRRQADWAFETVLDISQPDMATGRQDRHGKAALALEDHGLRQSFARDMAGLRRARRGHGARMLHHLVVDPLLLKVALNRSRNRHGSPPHDIHAAWRLEATGMKPLAIPPGGEPVAASVRGRNAGRGPASRSGPARNPPDIRGKCYAFPPAAATCRMSCVSREKVRHLFRRT